MAFTKRDVHQGEHVGDVIRSIREENQWSIQDLANRSGIKREHIEAFEEYRYNALPGQVYARNFLVQIARALRINESRLLSVFESEYKSFPFKKTFSPPHELSMPTLWTPKRIRTVLIFSLLFIAIGYVVVNISGFFTPPELQILSPEDNIEIHETSVEVHGTTDPGVEITINNAPIDVTDEGDFLAKVDLTIGVNTLTIVATKKFGQQKVEERNLLVQLKEDIIN